MSEEIKKERTPTFKIIDQILKEVKDFESGTVPLSEKVDFSQYQTLEEMRTHQNHGFLTSLADGQVDDRHYYDIISPMVDSGVANIDFDTKDFDINVLNGDHPAESLLAKAELRMFFKQTNHGAKINDTEEQFIDEGNIVARKVNNGEIYETVDLKNIMPLDQTAKNLEQTDVIERQIMNQTQLRKMTEWKNIDKVIQDGNLAKKGEVPYYEIFLRFGDISLHELNYTKSELKGTDYQDNEDDKKKYVPAQIIMARAKSGKKELSLNESKGIILFAEELQKEVIKINDRLKVEKYKPYSEAHFGSYKGRWLREGYREVGRNFQNRANELGNQIRIAMPLATRLILWSSDSNIAGKNILKNIEDGQIIKADHLAILNNAEKNLGLYAEEWNRNIEMARSALKAFEVATGESLPSSTSATAIAVQDKRVGKYYDFKSEKLGLFFKEVFNRWVLSELTKDMTAEHFLEITGDPSYMDTVYQAVVDGWYVKNLLKIGAHTPEEADFIKKAKLEELKKKPKLMVKIQKDFFKNVSLYIDINITGESISKQNKVTNGLALLSYITNPVIMQDPKAKKIVIDIANELGYQIGNEPEPALAPAPPNNPANSNNATKPAPMNNSNMPMV